MKAIIVAGGRGERLRPITDNIPKPMVEVKGKPILLHVVELLRKYGINEFIIALCYLPNVIIDFFGNGAKFGVKIIYTYEDSQNPLGTAGAISLARDLIDDTFIVTSCDILRDLDINKMLKFHKINQAFVTINVYRRVSNDAKSMVVINNDKRVIKFIERPRLKDLKEDYVWANGSFYIFDQKILNWIPENKRSDFGSDIFPELLKDKKDIYAYTSDGYFVDIGSIEKLDFAERTFKNNY